MVVDHNMAVDHSKAAVGSILLEVDTLLDTVDIEGHTLVLEVDMVHSEGHCMGLDSGQLGFGFERGLHHTEVAEESHSCHLDVPIVVSCLLIVR